MIFLQDCCTILKGYLTKSPPLKKASVHRWKRRYFVLCDPNHKGHVNNSPISLNTKPSSESAVLSVTEPKLLLLYYENKEKYDDGASPINQIDLTDAVVVDNREQIVKDRLTPFSITLATPKRTFYLCAETASDHKRWFCELNSSLEDHLKVCQSNYNQEKTESAIKSSRDANTKYRSFSLPLQNNFLEDREKVLGHPFEPLNTNKDPCIDFESSIETPYTVLLPPLLPPRALKYKTSNETIYENYQPKIEESSKIAKESSKIEKESSILIDEDGYVKSNTLSGLFVNDNEFGNGYGNKLGDSFGLGYESMHAYCVFKHEEN